MLKNLFKDMDLYKGIVLASVVLLPIGAWVLSSLQQRIEVAQSAYQDARRRGGQLERIGSLYKQLETLKKSSSRGAGIAADEPTRYFQTQITEKSVRELGFSDITLQTETEGGGRSGYKDTIIKIGFLQDGKNKRPLNQDQINAILYNCESQSQGVWKLHKFRMHNVESNSAYSGAKTPPRTVADKWEVDSLEFVKRQPDKSGGGRRGGGPRTRR